MHAELLVEVEPPPAASPSGRAAGGAASGVRGLGRGLGGNSSGARPSGAAGGPAGGAVGDALDGVIERTDGFSGSDLLELCAQAAQHVLAAYIKDAGGARE